MTLQNVKHVVLMPVGPEIRHEYVHDTIESIRHYTDPDRRIILVDDRGPNNRLQAEGDDLDVLVNPQPGGSQAMLYIIISMGIRYALEHYRFKVLLRLDDDALIIGSRPEDDAICRFKEQPNIGQLGSFRKTCTGYNRDISWPAGQLEKEMATSQANNKVKESKPDDLARQLRRIYTEARGHGYRAGEHSLGGATYFSYECLKRLVDSNLLGISALATSMLGEDHLMGMLVRAAGMDIGEFEQGVDPLCLDWLNLPCAPDEILNRGKKITHSVKRWHDMDQENIRAFFRGRRHQTGTNA
jgi:glycosyltransferase involved in cell wall biosynthesis